MAHAHSLHLETRSEELANTISHGIALVVALLAVPWLIHYTMTLHSSIAVIGASVFGTTVILSYLTSTVYHALPHGKSKRTFRRLDHMAIYLLIAGTYTPFTLGVLRGAWGWSLLIAIWILALLGVFAKSRDDVRYSRLSTIFYLVMGWLVVIAIVPLWMNMSRSGLLWLVSGGLAYSFGTIFYSRRSWPFSHFIWHLFVIAGTTCHFVAVSFYAMA